MERIKKEYVGTTIKKGISTYVLREDMTQKEIAFIKNMVSPHFVEEVVEEEIRNDFGTISEEELDLDAIPKNKPKRKKDDLHK